MLFFIKGTVSNLLNNRTFKYISCYSLSLFHKQDKYKSFLFKYISCYSLSMAQDGTLESLIKFKYISCYSLSTLAGSIFAGTT